MAEQFPQKHVDTDWATPLSAITGLVFLIRRRRKGDIWSVFCSGWKPAAALCTQGEVNYIGRGALDKHETVLGPTCMFYDVKKAKEVTLFADMRGVGFT